MNKLKSDDQNDLSHQPSIQNVFYFVGSAFIFFGIFFFLFTNWPSLNNFLKIFSTLGSAIAAYIAAVLLYLSKKHDKLGTAFFLVAAVTFPIGLYIVIDILRLNINPNQIGTLIYAICFGTFLLSYWYYPRNIFLLFSINYGSLFFLSLLQLIISHSILSFGDWTEYGFLSLGACYILLGYYLGEEKMHPLIGPLYFFGISYILSASYCLGGCFLNESLLRRYISGLLILASLFLAIPLKSKSFLYIGSIFMVIYIMDISYQVIDKIGTYGWPLILILCGFIFMFVGFLVIHLRKKII